jgi:hypothetical protein
VSFNVQQPTVEPPQDQGQFQGNLLERPVSREGHPGVSGSVSTSSRVSDVGADVDAGRDSSAGTDIGRGSDSSVGVPTIIISCHMV